LKKNMVPNRYLSLSPPFTSFGRRELRLNGLISTWKLFWKLCNTHSCRAGCLPHPVQSASFLPSTWLSALSTKCKNWIFGRSRVDRFFRFLLPLFFPLPLERKALFVAESTSGSSPNQNWISALNSNPSKSGDSTFGKEPSPGHASISF